MLAIDTELASSAALAICLSTYTPPTALVLHFLTPTSPWVAIVVALAVSFQCDSLVGKYVALIKDKELLAGEVMHEYDQKVSPSLCFPNQGGQ